MQIPNPEFRKCITCHNSISLNLYRLNHKECRFCQDGLVVPKNLIQTVNEAHNTLETESQLKSKFFNEPDLTSTHSENVPKNGSTDITETD